MLESYPCGEEELPENFRNQDVKVRPVRIESGKLIPLNI